MLPRLRIAWVMIAIAVVAVDFAALRAMLGSQELILLVLGGLPMANVLAIGILVGQLRPSTRSFLLGFEAFGVIALASFIAYGTLTSFFPDGIWPLSWYLALVFVPLGELIGQRGIFTGVIEIVVYAFMLGWPQVAFALIGGLLSRRFKVTVTRR